ncbi:MAG TPA: LysM peptidoglycan-binding domain-containing protein [Kofleriaceae bacterium]|nr:LysM peptidoglycan-binding domain-containing protein [Kofleriaceae bacterium]
MMRVPGPGATAALVTALAMTGLASRGSAQPIYPTAPPPPVTLDPGAPPAAPTPAPERPAPAQQPQQPPVIVIGPDGKIVPQPSQPQEPTGTYLGEGGEAGAPGEGPGVVQGGQVPELHVVRRGDTLWDICFLYFNDPWQWPKIWSYNPQITNPHWIYPGDLIRLLPRGVFGPAPGEPEVTPTAPGVVPPGPTEPLPAPQRRVEAAIKQTAFVEKAELERATTIDGALDEKVLLGNGDAVYLSYPAGRPPKVGERYSIYVPGNVVKSGGSEVGAYVHVLGTVAIESVKQDKRARGVIVDANQEIERGAKVGPLVKTFKTVPPSPPKVDAQGSIVAMLTNDQLIGQGEVVFIDLGKRSGLEVGNRMFVVRRGDAYPRHMTNQVGQDDRQFPARALGEIVIVEVGERISIGLVTLAVQEMSVGDLVMMQATR